MKAKKALVALCSFLCVCCVGMGVERMQTLASVADAEMVTLGEESVDVAGETNMTFHSETSTTVEIDLTFGSRTHVFPVGTTTATWVNDHASMGDVDLMQYIKIGGKTAREIVTANANGQLDKAYKGPISSSLGGQYSPIGVLVDSNGIIRIKTLTEYCAYENLTITLVSDGFAWTVNDPTLGTYTMTLSEDVTFYHKDGQFVRLSEELDVTSKVTMGLHSVANGVVEVDMTIGGVSNVMPVGTTAATWVNDHANMGNIDLMEYIKIGDRTAREIVTANANKELDKEYKGPISGSLGGQYSPIGVLVDGGGIIRIKVLTDYCAFENLEVTLLSGFTWTVNDPAMGVVTMKTTQDRVFAYYNGKFLEKLNRIVLDDKVTMSVNNFDVGGACDLEMSFADVTEVRAVDIMNDPNGWAKDGSWVNDNTKGYGGNDYSRGVDLMEYILINGRTARDIVVDNQKGKTNYSGPINNMSGIFSPIGICVEPDGVFRIKVLNEYCNYTNLRITLKEGLEWRVYNETNEQFDTALVTEEDTTFYYSNGRMEKWDNANDYVDLAENITVNMVGSSEDCDIYQIHFNQTFNAQAAWMMDKQTENPALYALQNVLSINGKTVQQINDETDDSAYEYKTIVVNWESHKVPVRVLFDCYNGKTLFTVYVHKNYVAENPIDTISLTSFAWSFQSVNHALKETVEFKAVTNESETIFKQVCYVTFGETDAVSVLEGDKLAENQIPADPTKESTEDKDFVFGGWYYTNVSGTEMKFEPAYTVVDGNYTLYPKFTEVARRYTITYLDKDGNVYQTQQVSNGDMIAYIATPELAHYTGRWVYQGEETAPIVMPTQDITFKVVYEAVVYKVVFYADANGMYEWKTLTYTVEDTGIQEPAVAPKEGFTGVWESYELTGGDVEVRPIYTEIPVVNDNGKADSNLFGCGSTLDAGLVAMVLITLMGAALQIKKKENE